MVSPVQPGQLSVTKEVPLKTSGPKERRRKQSESVAKPRTKAGDSRSLLVVKRAASLPSVKKEKISLVRPAQLSVIKEISERNSGLEEIKKASDSGNQRTKTANARSLWVGRKKPTTIPKGPHFHGIHVPKSCIRKMT